MRRDYILALSCPDRPGIVYRVSGLLFEHGCNILDAQQFGDGESGRFFLRVHFDVPADGDFDAVREAFAPLAEACGMEWAMHDVQRRARLLVLVSRQGHCLNDLLYRMRAGQLAIEVPLIVSNHRDFEDLAASYGIPFHHLPVTAATKQAQEAQVLELVRSHGVELVVLARYMQILSPTLCDALPGRIINIHHSFLPSFKGARPYHQAYERGVKIIGATAHFVTANLDEGPIIEQQVSRVNHGMEPKQLTVEGSNIESLTLATAVRWYTERRVFLDGVKTVVFA